MEYRKKVVYGEHPELRRRLPWAYAHERNLAASIPNREEDWEDSDVEIVVKLRWPPKRRIRPRKVRSLTSARKARKRIFHSEYEALTPVPFCTHTPFNSKSSGWPLCLPRVPPEHRAALERFHTNMNQDNPLPSQSFGYYTHPKLIKFPKPIHHVVKFCRDRAKLGFYDTAHEDAVKGAGLTSDADIPKLQKSFLWVIAAHCAQFTNDLDNSQRVRAIEKYSNLALCYFLDNPGFPARYFKYYGQIKTRAHYWGEIHHLQLIMPKKRIPEMQRMINHERYKRLWREYQFIRSVDRAVKLAAQKVEQKVEEKPQGKRFTRFIRGVFGKSSEKKKETDKENQSNQAGQNEAAGQEDKTKEGPNATTEIHKLKKLTGKDTKAGKQAVTAEQSHREGGAQAKGEAADKKASKDNIAPESHPRAERTRKRLTDYFDEHIARIPGSGPGGVPTVREYVDYCKNQGNNSMPGPSNSGPSNRPATQPKYRRPEDDRANRPLPMKNSMHKVIKNLQKREAKAKKDRIERMARAANMKAEQEALAANPCRVLTKWVPPPFPIPQATKLAPKQVKPVRSKASGIIVMV
ncbi:hypothetical protein ABW21_db0201682 [Orbilia brochopaga]|nr:hypothetical protein ABW21_db0201682 [Drechslerella brochopaga]